MNSDLFNKANKESAEKIEKAVLSADSIGIVGHIRPDGDDVGSCLGLARYINIIHPQAKVRVYLERFPEDFLFLAGANDVIHKFDEEVKHDLCFMLDCADVKRMGDAAHYFTDAAHKICIDHHATNDGSFDGFSVIEPERSSTSETICTLIDMDKLDQKAAECLYLGIVHDTGVFKHSNTHMETMVYAGKLLDLGARSDYVIDYTFYKKNFLQNRALGRTLLNARMELDGKLIISSFTVGEMASYGVTSAELDGCIDQLRVTEGVEIAAFIYEKAERGSFKISMRANGNSDVSKIAVKYGGGGHVKAAGCDIDGDLTEITAHLVQDIKEELISKGYLTADSEQ